MTARNIGYRPGLVDLASGQISREIFVNSEIYAEEQEKIFARAWQDGAAYCKSTPAASYVVDI